MVIFVPKNGRRIVVIFEISEIGSCQNDNAVKYQDISFFGKKFFDEIDEIDEIHN